MKLKDTIPLIITLLIIYFSFEFFKSEKVIIKKEIEYVKGTSDTVTITQTTIRRIKDTIRVDSEGSLEDSTIRSSLFSIKQDSVSVSGRVEFDKRREQFSFTNIAIRFPFIIQRIERVDTLIQTLSIDKPIYENHWFWGFVVILGLFIWSLS